MRKLILLTFLLVLMGTAQAADFSPSVVIDRIANSIVRVQTKRVRPDNSELITSSSGSGFIVSSDDTETIVVTAKHVVDDPLAIMYCVLFGDKAYLTACCNKLDNTDAAYLIFQPGIKGAKALKFNLSPSDNNIDAICFGYAQRIHLVDEAPKPTFTVGKLSRKVCAKLLYGKGEIVTGMLYGTPTLLFGYSGGPCVDLDYNLLGINVCINSQETMFIDSRVLWNNIPELNKDWLVKVPFDPAFNVLNNLGEKRIPVDKNATISVDNSTTALETYLATLLNEVVKDPAAIAASMVGMSTGMPEKARAWLNPTTYFTINGKKYVLYQAELNIVGYQSYHTRVAYREDEKQYIYICSDGWEASISLYEATPEIIQKIHKTWANK